MQVIKAEPIRTNKGTLALTAYTLDTGHEAHIYALDDFFVYTKSGNYASQSTARKVLSTIAIYNATK